MAGDMGYLYPAACYEVLPGDSVRQSTQALIRLPPLVSPVMHPVIVKIHHWYVPSRLLWTGWEDFITGVDTATAIPTITIPSTVGGLCDHMGLDPAARS